MRRRVRPRSPARPAAGERRRSHVRRPRVIPSRRSRRRGPRSPCRSRRTARSPGAAAAGGPPVLRARSSTGRERHADHLVVDALLVAHREQADRLDRDQAAREGWLVEAHEGIQRIAVLAERSAQVAVVGRVGRRAHQQPVELDPPSCGSYSYLLRMPFGISTTQTRRRSDSPLRCSRRGLDGLRVTRR